MHKGTLKSVTTEDKGECKFFPLRRGPRISEPYTQTLMALAHALKKHFNNHTRSLRP